MKTNIIVPPMHAVAILTTGPTVAYRVVDGIAVYLAQFDKRATQKPLNEEWELQLETEEEPIYRLINKSGFENHDPRPIEIPLDLRTTPSLRDLVIEHISRYVTARAVDEGYETLEEAHDFDIGGEIDDLATEAETSFLASFAPHQGRAANDNATGVAAIPQTDASALKPAANAKGPKIMQEEQPPAD